MYDSYHEIENISNPNGEKKPYNVVGYICETDNFAEDRPLPEISEGDILAIRNAGAYGFTMASQYNSRVRPAEVMVFQGKDYLVRERETLADILNRQIAIDIWEAVWIRIARIILRYFRIQISTQLLIYSF